MKRDVIIGYLHVLMKMSGVVVDTNERASLVKIYLTYGIKWDDACALVGEPQSLFL